MDGKSCPCQLLGANSIPRGTRSAPFRAHVVCAANLIMLECAPFQAQKDNQNEHCHLCPRSSEKQMKEGTIDSQIEALKDYAKAHNLNIVFECLDDGFSGTTLDRPGLDQLRDLAQSGNIEGVLILAPDRLSRKQANQIILMEEFKKKYSGYLYQSERRYSSNFMLQIQGALRT
jgi:hypothetical protein